MNNTLLYLTGFAVLAIAGCLGIAIGFWLFVPGAGF
jgi:hypothetical protein